jgi:hypothetical protein
VVTATVCGDGDRLGSRDDPIDRHTADIDEHGGDIGPSRHGRDSDAALSQDLQSRGKPAFVLPDRGHGLGGARGQSPVTLPVGSTGELVTISMMQGYVG